MIWSTVKVWKEENQDLFIGGIWTLKLSDFENCSCVFSLRHYLIHCSFHTTLWLLLCHQFTWFECSFDGSARKSKFVNGIKNIDSITNYPRVCRWWYNYSLRAASFIHKLINAYKQQYSKFMMNMGTSRTKQLITPRCSKHHCTSLAVEGAAERNMIPLVVRDKNVALTEELNAHVSFWVFVGCF